jgi:hypothetical protein
MTAAHPASSRRRAVTRSSEVYASTVNPSSTRTFAASMVACTSGTRVRSSPITSSLTQSLIPAARPSRA